MKIGLERWDGNADSLIALWEDGLREIGMEKPEVDREALQADAESLVLAVAREESIAVGFALFGLVPDLMRKGRRQAAQLCWYVRKDAGGIGLAILHRVLEECRRRGAVEAILVAPALGRGACTAPRAFALLGAERRQQDYSLELEE
jgi:hypothetical protein